MYPGQRVKSWVCTLKCEYDILKYPLQIFKELPVGRQVTAFTTFCCKCFQEEGQIKQKL
jgi:hypothetical protein